MESIIHIRIYQWLSESYLTKLLFLFIFCGISMILYSVSKHSRDKTFFRKSYRYDYNAYKNYFLNTLCYFSNAVFKITIYLGSGLSLGCLFLNSSISYWVFLTLSSLIVFLTVFRLLINIKEKTIFLLPKWKHPDSDIRIMSVKNISNEKILRKIVMTDSNPGIKKIALEKIDNQKILEHIVNQNTDPSLRIIALKKDRKQRVNRAYSNR